MENCRGPLYERLDALSGILAGHNAIPDFRHRANFKISVDLVCDFLEFAEITQGVEVFSQAGEMSVGTGSLQRRDGYVRSNGILSDHDRPLFCSVGLARSPLVVAIMMTGIARETSANGGIVLLPPDDPALGFRNAIHCRVGRG